MERNETNLLRWVERFNSGEFDNPDVDTQCDAGWFDWFCKDTSLVKKTEKMGRKLAQLVKSHKLDPENQYVFFKNNCPGAGSLYDSFSICDIGSGNVQYWITPASGQASKKGLAQVFSPVNGFKEPLAEGTWSDVKKYFLS